MKRRVKKKNYKKTKDSKIGALILLLIIFFGFWFITKIIDSKKEQVLENRKAEMKEVPEDVKEEIKSLTPSLTFKVPILMYHYVEYVKDEKDTIRKSLDITPDVFEKQVKTFVDQNYTFMTMSEVGDVLNGKWEMPEKAVVFTFDDGYRDFYTDVFPILKKYKVKATVYIVSGFIGDSNFMLTNQIQEIIDSGLVEIGAHTVNHVSLKERSLESVYYEINRGKNNLEKQFNVEVVSFAYPFGAFDAQAIELVKDLGFKTSVSTIEGVLVNQQNRYFIYRIRPGLQIGRDLINYIDNLAKKEKESIVQLPY